MKLKLFFFCLFALQSTDALEVKLAPCQKLGAQITDLEFLTNSKFFVSSKDGDLLFVDGCGKDVKTITHLDVKSNSELGLLGLALGSSFTESGSRGITKQALYIYYSPARKSDTITRLSMFDFYEDNTGVVVDGEKKLLEIAQPFSNHDGGALKIGPDGNLYLGVGDGGSGGDPHNHGQNEKTLLGTIVRIRPDNHVAGTYTIPSGNLHEFVKGAAPEILAMGLRNPWKFSFDSAGNLIVADVGQNKIEEISIIAAASMGKKALNLGWRIKEAKACFKPEKNCGTQGLLDPVFQYERNFGASITGGETLFYKGEEYYFFADYVSGAIGAIKLKERSNLAAQRTMRGNNWTTFGKSPSGDVYIANIQGDIYRVSLEN